MNQAVHKHLKFDSIKNSFMFDCLLWEPKMCRLALQLLGMLGNVLDQPRHALQRPRHALQGPWSTSACFCKVLGVPHRRETPLLAAL